MQSCVVMVQFSKAEALNSNSTFLNIFSVEAYLDILPDGCFDANEAGMKYLCYTETDSLTSYRAEEVKEPFYQPDAVQKVLKEYN